MTPPYVQLLLHLWERVEALEKRPTCKQSLQVPPTPEPAAPTVMEIIELHSWLEDEWRANNDGEDLPMLDYARAVLARWGRASQPVPVREEPSNEELLELRRSTSWRTSSDEFINIARAVLARWGRQTR